jgi:hypothetical protein
MTVVISSSDKNAGACTTVLQDAVQAGLADNVKII